MNGTINLHWDDEISIVDGLREEKTITYVVDPQLTTRGHASTTKTQFVTWQIWGQKKKKEKRTQQQRCAKTTPSPLLSFNLCGNLTADNGAVNLRQTWAAGGHAGV